MGLPALAQDLGATPAVVWMEFDAEEVAHLRDRSRRCWPVGG
jgi:hypothetical protein